MIIGIAGKIHSGKDTVAKIISEYYKKLGFSVYRVAFGDNVKDVVELITGEVRTLVDETSYNLPVYDYTTDQKSKYLDEWKMTIRDILQKLATDAMRNNFDKDVWIKSTFKKINSKKDIFLIPDVRFKNEAEYIKNKGGKLIKVEGDPLKMQEVLKEKAFHESEISLDSYLNFDIRIKNITTVEILKRKVYQYLNTLI